MQQTIITFIIFAFPVIAFSDTIIVPDDYTTIQGAIDAAVDGDTVLVKPDTYVENIDFLGKAITVKSSDGAEVTVIGGGNPVDPDYGSVVTFINGEGVDSVLEGFNLTNGTGTKFEWQPGYWDNCGGGIFCDGSSPTITNTTITGNTAEGQGGGICCYGSSLTITDTTITGNTASIYGGGIYCYDSSPTITSTTITGNTASYHGGGICCQNNSSPTIANTTITKNTASIFGGGIFCYIYSSPTITSTTITGNTADYDGGGIFCYIYSSPTITENTITGNTSNCGGGISCENNSAPTITNTTITGNAAILYGGGICCYDSSPIITNNIITGNTAGYDGGGFYCYNSSPTITSTTITGNMVGNDGGGICCCYGASPTITNTILWDNTASTGPEIWIGSATYPSTLTISYSDAEGGKSSVHVDPGCTLNWGPGMIDANPLLVQGPNGFIYLSQVAAGQPIDSPCVDTGSDLASNLGMNIYWTRTDEVPDSGTVDMGFHYGPFTFPRLQTDIFQIVESAGGTAHFLLNAGTVNANRNYLLLGSISGTDPGTPLPSGMVTLPLNWDIFTTLVIDLLNTSIFSNFMGTMDGTGSASATFDTFGPIVGAQGLTFHFAYALNTPWDFVSNPVGIEIVP